MPRVTEEHRAAQRERIKAAALAVARRDGLGGLSMNAVIRESGLSAGAIYGYFANKEQLVSSLAGELVAGRLDAIEALALVRPLPTPTDVVRAIVEGAPPEVVDGGLVLEVWAGGARDEVFAPFAREQLTRITESLGRYLAVWLSERGWSPEEAGPTGLRLAPVLLGVAQGYLIRGAVAGDQGEADYLAALDALDVVAARGVL